MAAFSSGFSFLTLLFDVVDPELSCKLPAQIYNEWSLFIRHQLKDLFDDTLRALHESLLFGSVRLTR